ncbi:MAG: BamA/TamA family outer membrane protein [Candidatus Gastranaerophilales bacterium]|nr:BamA/TamA family outer membrane protein [Candidatus Gastranaerophilales bacterium]
MNKFNKLSAFIFFLILGLAVRQNTVCAEEMQTPRLQDKTLQTLENETPQQLKTESKKENPGIYIKDIRITGNNLVRQEDILNAISTKTGMLYDRDLIKVNLREIYDMGYFSDKIKASPVMTPEGVVLNIQVEENVPITGFVITGNEVISTAEIQAILSNQVGMPQNIVEINEVIGAIENYYAEHGYILARVKDIHDEPDGTVFVEVNEGIIDEIRYTGNTKTKDYVIERNISVIPNTIYNDNIMQKDIMRLYNTQAFANVKRSLSPSENDPEKYCLTVELEEKRTGSISVGGGLDLTTGLFGTVGYADRNFLGRGQQTSVNFSTGTGAMMSGSDVLNRADFQFEAKLTEPRLMGTMISMDNTVYGSSWASFQIPLAIEKRIGGSIEFAKPLKKYPHLIAGLGFGMEFDKVEEGDEAQARQRFLAHGIPFSERAEQLVSGTYLSLSPTLIYDTRDNPIAPRNGVFAMGKIKGALKIAGDAGSYASVTGSIKKFFPVAKASTLITSAKVAGNLAGDMPEFAAYRLGGARNIRGFKEGHMGRGYGYVMGSVEYRTPIPLLDKVTSNEFLNSTRLAAFVDASQMFSPTLSNKLYSFPGYAIVAGVGVRFFIPGLGPLSLDYGIPLTGVGENNSQNGQFTFFFGETY